MSAKSHEWEDELPGTGKELLAAGYLKACQSKGSALSVEGFLDFDEEQIQRGLKSSVSLARVAAVAHSLLPWVSPDSSDIAARVVVDFTNLHQQKGTGAAMTRWLLGNWNPSRLAVATGWPEYEVGLHVVDIDVVMGWVVSHESDLPVFKDGGCNQHEVLTWDIYGGNRRH